jgi:SpoVK/Ycf46/Vps4 family AAA+-type ATPase
MLNDRQSDLRYMIDYSTWNRHAQHKPAENREYLAPDFMRRETPPEPMLLLLPHIIVGFDMINKKWSHLKVSNITDVVWNKEAFQSLVIEDEMKICVQALVSNQITGEKSTDLVYGKGNGLVILLHGPPGTGKTLTAESVAELAEKPLYRVTCGDIGTDPAAVERHLQAALNLGKVWGCVVLLDEADIFLEERSLHDLARNALVSVFLRALEYYDGILILTTNRVGTFDEAFKSRIQLSLHYQRLTENQRGVVWENFLRRLEKIDEDNINIEDLRRSLHELARYDMNGRQILNALTTARQRALFAGEVVDFRHLKRAIRVSTKFDQYLRSVKHGATDDDIARDDGIR